VDRRRVTSGLAGAALGTLLAVTGARAFAQTPGALGGAAAAAAAADVWRARAEVSHAGAELARARELGRRGMLSEADLDDRRLAYDRARADWLRSAVAALGAGRHVVIERAVKRRRADGTVLVRLDLSPVAGDSALTPPPGLDDLPDVLHAAEVRNLVVSVKADAGPNGAAIGRPYERVIPRLAFGAHALAEFELLEDAAEVVVATSVGERAEERRVRLENDATVDGVAIRAAQFSLEGELGTEVVYDLVLEPSGSRTPVLRLAVEGLPGAMRAELRDPATKTRIVQVRMPEGAVAQHLQLAVSLPPTATGGVRTDSLLRFAVVATADADGAGAAHGPARTVARLALELVGRGVGRVELQPASLYLEAAPGDTLDLPVRVRNVGTRALSDVRVTTEPANGWSVVARPARIASLGAGDVQTTGLRITLPRDVPTGEYEVRLGIEGDARARGGEDRVLRVRVAPRGGAFGTGALVAAFAVVGVALVAFARRLVYR